MLKTHIKRFQENPMLRRLTLVSLFLSVFSLSPLTTAETSARPDSLQYAGYGYTAAQTPIASPVIFEVRPPNGTPVSYLFGTFHYGVGLDDMPKKFLGIFNTAQVHIYEMNVSQEFSLFRRFKTDPDHAIPESLKLVGMDPDAPGDFSEAEVSQLVALGVPEKVAKKMKDWQCNLFIARKVFFQAPTIHSLDAELQLRTVQAKKQLVELESQSVRDEARKKATEQGYDHSCSIRSLLQNPAQIVAVDASFASFIQDYRRLTPAQALSLPDDDDPDVAIRNQVWMTKLPQILSQNSSFIAVGFGHLPGRMGLIQMLRNQGYTIRPLQIGD